MTARANYQMVTSLDEHGITMRRALLACGILGAALYPAADIIATTHYPGFSYKDQAVSELFAIGAPTSGLLVPLFTLSSTLLLLFSIGIWMSAHGQRRMRLMAAMMTLSMIDALVLWNVFPMHMRASPKTFTDTMHVLLAIDPFVMAVVVLGAVNFCGPFRIYTIATLVITSILAILSFSYVPALSNNGPTPWMGAVERAAQYATNLWYAVLAVMLLHRHQSAPYST